MTLLEAFAKLPDPRAANKRYALADMVFIAVCMVLCGAEDWEMVESLGKAKLSWLRRFIDLPHGIPSHDTFSRVFARLKPEAFQQCFMEWVQTIAQSALGEVVAVDGKTLRRSYDRADDKGAIHMVSAWASASGLVLGQLKTDAKSNEITAIPALLEMLELSGCIVTIDAMGCQKAIAQTIRAQEADYVLALKGNQGTLFEDCQLYLESLAQRSTLPTTAHYHESVDKGHGRIEIRRCWISTDIDWLEQREQWLDLGLIAMVESERHHGGKISCERRYFISSLRTDAATVLKAVRAHWTVENNLHWVLDVAFGEDGCRIRKDHGAENMALFRHIVLNLIKQEKSVKLGVKNRRILAAADDDYRMKVLKTAI